MVLFLIVSYKNVSVHNGLKKLKSKVSVLVEKTIYNFINVLYFTLYSGKYIHRQIYVCVQ